MTYKFNINTGMYTISKLRALVEKSIDNYDQRFVKDLCDNLQQLSIVSFRAWHQHDGNYIISIFYECSVCQHISFSKIHSQRLLNHAQHIGMHLSYDVIELLVACVPKLAYGMCIDCHGALLS